MKWSKTHLFKIGQSGGFLSRLLGPPLKFGLPLIKNVLKSLAKNVLILSGLTAAASVTDSAVQKKSLGLGLSTPIISNEETDGIIKKELSLSKTLVYWQRVLWKWSKRKKRWISRYIIRYIRASLLENLLTGKEVMRRAEGTIRPGEGTVKAGQEF